MNKLTDNYEEIPLEKNNSNNNIIIPEDLVSREEEIRDTWDNHAEFILSCIGFSVGLGNIWRFPYICYANGGGAFLIPYFTMLLLCGLPLYFMELSFGQYTGFGPPKCFLLCPIIKGVGWAQMTILFIISIYYNIIMGYALFYLISSLRKNLMWNHCDNIFNTENCDTFYTRSMKNENSTSTIGLVPYNLTFSEANYTDIAKTKTVSSTEEFWLHYILEIGKSPGLHDLGGLRWPLVGLLFLSWMFVFACISKGIKSVGKIAYFTSLFPYVVLFILLIRGVTLDGSKEGILYFFTPHWEKLKELKVWSAAAGQVFFSEGIGWGCLIAFSSYGKYQNRCYRDAVFISILDTFTSLLSGLVIFSVLGYMSKQLQVPVSEVSTSGQGLAFIVFPEAISQLPVPQLWNVLFFVMLFDLGLNSEFALIEALVSGLQDSFPSYFPKKKRIYIRLGFCLACFLIGLPFVTRGGQYLITLLDFFCSEISLIFIGATEVIGLMWIYGVRHYLKDIETMMGVKLPLRFYWITCWCLIAPVALWTILIYSLSSLEGMSYMDYKYPRWGIWIGILISLITILMIPLGAIHSLIYQEDRGFKRLTNSTKPSPTFQGHLKERAIRYGSGDVLTCSISNPIYKISHTKM